MCWCRSNRWWPPLFHEGEGVEVVGVRKCFAHNSWDNYRFKDERGPTQCSVSLFLCVWCRCDWWWWEKRGTMGEKTNKRSSSGWGDADGMKTANEEWISPSQCLRANKRMKRWTTAILRLAVRCSPSSWWVAPPFNTLSCSKSPISVLKTITDLPEGRIYTAVSANKTRLRAW